MRLNSFYYYSVAVALLVFQHDSTTTTTIFAFTPMAVTQPPQRVTTTSLWMVRASNLYHTK